MSSKAVMRSQKRKKIDAVNLFGGCCQKCGYDKCVEALEFHHLDKNEKEEKPSYIIMRWSWERVKEELEKCILLCSNCHKEVHALEKEGVSIDLQIYLKPWLNKTCDYCQEEYQTKREEQKFCSTRCKHFGDRKVVRPTKEELEELIRNKTTWTKIGKMFGVSDNAVRKWAKKYNII